MNSTLRHCQQHNINPIASGFNTMPLWSLINSTQKVESLDSRSTVNYEGKATRSRPGM